MSRDTGKILYETHEEILREATKQKDTRIRDLERVIERMRKKIKGLEETIAGMPTGPVETAKKILE